MSEAMRSPVWLQKMKVVRRKNDVAVRRFCARWVDVLFFATIVHSTVTFTYSWPIVYIIESCAYVTCEWMQVWAFGNTLSKRLFGIRIISADEQALSSRSIYARCWLVYVLGLAAGIVPLLVATHALAFKRVTEGNNQIWDDLIGSRVVRSQPRGADHPRRRHEADPHL